MLNSHVTSPTQRNQIRWLVSRLPVAVKCSERNDVMNGESRLSACLTSVIVALSDFSCQRNPQRPAIKAILPTFPIASMNAVNSLVNGPVFVSTFRRTSISNTAFKCAHLLPALFAIPRSLTATFLRSCVWPGQTRNEFTSAPIGAKGCIPIRPILEMFTAFLANKDGLLDRIGMVQLRGAAFWGTEAIGAVVLSHKRLAARFTHKFGREIFAMVRHMTSLASVRSRSAMGTPPRVRRLSVIDRITQAHLNYSTGCNYD